MKKFDTKQEFLFDGTKVWFAATGDSQLPYRVIVDRTARGWLNWKYEPGKQAAKYFYTKLVLGQDKPELLEKALKKEKKPLAWSVEGFAKWLDDHQFDKVGHVGTWRTWDNPLELYIAEMKEADKWIKKQFAYKSVNGGTLHVNRTRWMERLNKYLETAKTEDDLYGFEMRTILLNKAVWDKKEYDITW